MASPGPQFTRDYIPDPMERRGQIQFVVMGSPPDEMPTEMIQDLSIQDKQTIFRDFLPLQSFQEEYGRALLERLQIISPSTASQFELKTDLVVEDFALRLINMREDPNVAEISYIALSYCWSPEYMPSNASYRSEPEMPLPVHGHLFQAAVLERDFPDEGLWIDQICIDQTSDTEKAVAIPAMSALYKHARKIIVCLGDIEISMEEMIFLINYKDHYENQSLEWGEFPHRGEQPPFMMSNPTFRNFFHKICSSRWFTRAWCSHEMRLGQKLHFYIRCADVPGRGGQHVIFGFSDQFLFSMLQLDSELPSGCGNVRYVKDTLMRHIHLQKQIDRTRRRIRNEPEDSTPITRYTPLVQDIFSLATGGDPRIADEQARLCNANQDKISIVLNVVGNGLRLKRDDSIDIAEYSTDDKCIKTLLLLALAAGDPLALCTLGDPLRLGDPAGNHPASFLCATSTKDTGSFPDPMDLPPMAASGITVDTSPLTRWIETPGYDLVHGEYPPPSYVQSAAILIQLCSQHDLGLAPGHEQLTEWGPGPGYQYWRYQTAAAPRSECFVQTVACLFALGKTWVLETAKLCGFPKLDELGRLFADADFWTANETVAESEVLVRLLVAAGEEHRARLTATMEPMLRMANWMVSWGVDMARSYGSAGLLKRPMMYAVGGKRLVVFWSGNEGDQVFVPACLCTDAYSRLARVWIVGSAGAPPGAPSSDEDEGMVMLEKTRIFGGGGLMEGERGDWERVDKARIYGSPLV